MESSSNQQENQSDQQDKQNKDELSEQEKDEMEEFLSFVQPKSLQQAGKTLIDVQFMHLNEKKEKECGYCKSKKQNPGSASWGISSPRLSSKDYQIMMDRGWRRCGQYIYKYDLEKSCCQPYTIRLDVTEFQITKSQKKVLKNFNNFLIFGQKEENLEAKSDEKVEKEQIFSMNCDEEEDIKQKIIILKAFVQIIQKLINISKEELDLENLCFKNYQTLQNGVIISSCREKALQNTKSWTCNLLIKIFYFIKNAKLQISQQSPQEFSKYVYQELIDQTKYNLKCEDSGFIVFIDNAPLIKNNEQSIPKKQKKINLKPQIEEINDDQVNEPQYFQFFKQHIPLQTINQLTQKPIKLKHQYTVEITRAIFNQESFEVYNKYQKKVHGDKKVGSKEQYDRFLCQVPIFDPKIQIIPEEASQEEVKNIIEEQKEEGDRIITKQIVKNLDLKRISKVQGVWPKLNGGYHMLHRIDGELMAVGVIDITPEALSSVYLFYDPKFEFINPGTFCCLREIEYIQMIQEKFNPEFKFYYLGLYFQDCQKSVYKAQYKPSQVSCPYTHNYVYLSDEVKKLIDTEKKPNLYQTVVINKKDPELQEQGLYDHRKIDKGQYIFMSRQQAEKMVQNGYKILYGDQMIVRIDDMSPDHQQKLKNTAIEIYQQLGIDIIMNCQFVIIF